MLKVKTVAVILALGLFSINTGLSKTATVEDNWNDYLHYTKIGRLDMAADYAQAVLDGNPDPVQLLALSEKNQQGYAIVLKVIESAPDVKLTELSKKILAIIEQGRFIRRTDPKVIVEEIRRLSSTERGRMTAVKRLQNAGEYSIMYMLDALADESRKDEAANIIWALPQVGRDSLRPLAAAMQSKNVPIKAEIIKAMGKVGYPQSLAYLKYVMEKDESSELRGLAEQSIKQIDASALKTSAAELFFQLGEEYYYHAQSLKPAEDANFANIWFWDADKQQLTREKVDKNYFYELMAMRQSEWALKADAGFGQAIGLWLASFFKVESAGVDMPAYFGQGHANAHVYATTAGAEYLHQALARAIKDNNAYVALGAVEALAVTAGEKSLFYRLGVAQPLLQALTFKDRSVRYSAAIAIAAAGPKENFGESKYVVENLAQAITKQAGDANDNKNPWNDSIADSYTLRAAQAMLKLSQTQNTVINLSGAQAALIDATKGNSPEIRILAAQILAYLNSPDAQRAIAAMALAEGNPMDIRIAAFNSLAVSAKFNANLLDNETINTIYTLLGSKDADPQLRSAAAAAYGAFNLPSQKVKDLILDQSRS